MKRNYFSRKIRQFKNLSGRVNQLILSGEWVKLSEETRNNFILKLNLLFRELSRFFSQFELKKILAAAAIFIGFPLAMQSQAFAPPLKNPFWYIPPDSDMAPPAFADIDADHDMDLFLGDYEGNIHFYENTGTPTTPAFPTHLQNPFGLVPNSDPLAFPAMVDIDKDGDIDLFVGGYNGIIKYYENTGSSFSPAFAPPLWNPFGLVPAQQFAIPTFGDIDDDGDLDLFVGEYYGMMKYYENTGTDILPHFAAPIQNPFGITQAYNIGSPAFTDIDHDGDLDLFVGEYYGDMLYFENTGTATVPAFAAPLTNPFGLVPTNYYSFPAFADLDNDEDEDLIVGELNSDIEYFKNTEFNIGIPENGQTALFDLYPNPANDEVFVRMENGHSGFPSEVSIMDLSGKILKTALLDTDDLRLKTDDLSPGVYFVRLVRDDEVFTRKLVIR